MLRELGKIFTDTRTEWENTAVHHKTEQAGRFDRKLFIVCITSALCLVFINYLGTVSRFISFLDAIGLPNLSAAMDRAYENAANKKLFHLRYWALMLFCFYFILPVLVIRFVLKEKLRDYALSFSGALAGYRIYLSLIAVMVPVVVAVSFTASFQAKYPFYNPVPGESLYPDFFTWECFYLLQFVGLEFFFRGFLLHGTKRQFGYYSVLLMMIPYCMIHFGKPMAETIGAIAAGIVLGTLSLKSRSIWLGVAIHYSVAITMDLCALWQKGFFNH